MIKKTLIIVTLFFSASFANAAKWQKLDETTASFKGVRAELKDRITRIQAFKIKSVKESEEIENSLKQLTYIIAASPLERVVLSQGDKYFDVFSGERNSLLRILEDYVGARKGLTVYEGSYYPKNRYEEELPENYLKCDFAYIYNAKSKEVLYLSTGCKVIPIDYSNYE